MNVRTKCSKHINIYVGSTSPFWKTFTSMKSTIINTNISSNRKDKNEERKMQDKCLGSR